MTNTLQRALCRIGLAGAIFLAPDSSYAQQVSCHDISPSKLAEADEVLEAFGYNPGQPTSQFELTVQAELKELGASNPRWSPSHPSWKEVADQVRSDLSRIMRSASEVLTDGIRPTARCIYARVLSTDDLNGLKRYLDSEIGRRHLQFDVELRGVLHEAMHRAMLYAKSPDPKSLLETPPASLVLSRLDLIQSSLAIGIFQRAGESTKQKGGETSGYGVMRFIFGDLASRHGQPLDALRAKYAGDLMSFRDFNRSPEMARHGEAWAEISSSSSFRTAYIRYIEVLSTDWAKSGQNWKRRYQEIAVSDASLQAPSATESP